MRERRRTGEGVSVTSKAFVKRCRRIAQISTDPTNGVTVNASIGQFFATGLAARDLALKGGAQTFNPAASAPTDASYFPNYQPVDDANGAAIAAALGDPFEVNKKKLLTAARAQTPPIDSYDATNLATKTSVADFMAYTAGKLGLRQLLANAAKGLH